MFFESTQNGDPSPTRRIVWRAKSTSQEVQPTQRLQAERDKVANGPSRGGNSIMSRTQAAAPPTDGERQQKKASILD